MDLGKDIFLKEKYKNLNMKKIVPCKILKKFVANAYEIELPENLGISPIFTIANLYPYSMDDTRDTNALEEIQWK